MEAGSGQIGIHNHSAAFMSDARIGIPSAIEAVASGSVERLRFRIVRLGAMARFLAPLHALHPRPSRFFGGQRPVDAHTKVLGRVSPLAKCGQYRHWFEANYVERAGVIIAVDGTAQVEGASDAEEGSMQPITPISTDIPVIGIVDDDEDVRIALEALVASIGFTSKMFETADALLASGRLAELDCVVTDLQMPGMNGLSLARHIQRTRPMPVILITAFPAPGLDEQAATAGVRCLLRKPFDPLALIDELEAIAR